MTREEFAERMGYLVDHLPGNPPATWDEIYANACHECKAFNLRGRFPMIHHDACSQRRRGYIEGIRRATECRNENVR